ncbi:MAG: CHC2 zinc finger domain-containing protein [Verrucomicrobiota bacterium]
MNTWINFKELREKLNFETVLRDFGVEVKRNGTQHKGPCPLPGHDGERKAPAFSAELQRGLFRCFGCGRKGNALEFAALMEGVDPENGAELRRVAVRLRERYVKQKGAPSPTQVRTKPLPPPKGETPKVTAVNAPLDFELKGLDPVHPGIQKMGFTEETANTFGFGVTDRGSLKGRIAIPLHDSQGRLVGYAGRALENGRSAPDNPKYVFPERRERNGAIHEFRRGEILYNAHRILTPKDEIVVVAEIEAAWTLHQWGWSGVVSVMGTGISSAQLEILDGLVTPIGRILVIGGSDSPPDDYRIAGLLASIRAVRMLRLPGEILPAGVDVSSVKEMLK